MEKGAFTVLVRGNGKVLVMVKLHFFLSEQFDPVGRTGKSNLHRGRVSWVGQYRKGRSLPLLK